ncbi:hypothetical protein [Spirosoma sp.]|uniref:hypothetical protein n=1 Tax=Spirosoma sp. TaxID=1899569 RepID=UPI0026369819|nr:hypothetical protein [Spirosoma sp.]MCX6213827.1 hypothetical protein [Spirosoma sp.]
MKTTKGTIKIQFSILGDRASYFTMLRTHRHQLLYYHGPVFPDSDSDGYFHLTKKARARYENQYFLKHAVHLIVDSTLLYTAFMPCLNWKHLEDTQITYDGTNWQLTLQVDDKYLSFCHDTVTDEFADWVNRLELIIRRPLMARGFYYE